MRKIRMPTSVMRMVTGIARAVTMVVAVFRRNRYRTTIDSASPKKMLSQTLPTASRTKSD